MLIVNSIQFNTVSPPVRPLPCLPGCPIRTQFEHQYLASFLLSLSLFTVRCSLFSESGSGSGSEIEIEKFQKDGRTVYIVTS